MWLAAPVQAEPEVRTVTVIERDPNAIVPSGDLVEISALLARLAVVAKALSPADARRARDLTASTYSLLRATTEMPDADQRMFQNALHEAAARAR